MRHKRAPRGLFLRFSIYFQLPFVVKYIRESMPSERIREMKKRVLVVSSANMDMVQRIRRVPASGETVLEQRGSYSYVPGGKGANSAIAMARLGADCVFVCKVGDDANGKILTNLYRSEGIDVRYVIVDPDALEEELAVSDMEFWTTSARS